jgi:hypothetical protein
VRRDEATCWRGRAAGRYDEAKSVGMPPVIDELPGFAGLEARNALTICISDLGCPAKTAGTLIYGQPCIWLSNEGSQ